MPLEIIPLKRDGNIMRIEKIGEFFSAWQRRLNQKLYLNRSHTREELESRFQELRIIYSKRQPCRPPVPSLRTEPRLRPTGHRLGGTSE